MRWFGLKWFICATVGHKNMSPPLGQLYCDRCRLGEKWKRRRQGNDS